MAYTDEEINIMARQLVEASKGGGGLEKIFGGTDDDVFEDIMGRVSQLPKEEKQRVVAGINTYLTQEGVDNNGYTNLRDMIKGEFSNMDWGEGEEDAAMQAFGLARDNLIGQHEDEIIAGEGEDNTVDFNRPTELPEPGDVNKREPEPPAEDDEGIRRGPEENAREAEKAREEGNEELAKFFEGPFVPLKDVPEGEQVIGREPPELDPMEVEEKKPEDFFNFHGLNTTLIEGPEGPEIHGVKPFDVPDVGPPPERRIATPEQLEKNPDAQTELDIMHRLDLEQHQKAIKQAAGIKGANEKMVEKAKADNAAALQPKPFQAPNFVGGDAKFNEFKAQVAERQWRDQQNKRIKANEALMKNFQEINPSSPKFDSRYRQMSSWYANKFGEGAKPMSEMTPSEALELKQMFREDVQRQAIARAEARAPKLYTDEDVERALREQGAMQVAEDDGRGGVRTRWMAGDQYDDWNASRGMPTRRQMQTARTARFADPDDPNSKGIFSLRELKPEHGGREGSGVMGDWQGNVNPQDPFRNPAEPEPPGLPTPEEQAEMQVAQKFGLTLEELRKRRQVGSLPPHLKAYRNLETDVIPPEIEQLYLNNQAITEAQNRVNQLEQAVEMAREIEAQGNPDPIETLMDIEGIPYDESGPTNIYDGPLQDPMEALLNSGPTYPIVDSDTREALLNSGPTYPIVDAQLPLDDVITDRIPQTLMDIEGIPYDESGPLDMDFDEELRRKHAPGSVGAFFDSY